MTKNDRFRPHRPLLIYPISTEYRKRREYLHIVRVWVGREQRIR